MYLADAKCDDCGHIYSISKAKIMDDFKSGKCPECKSKKTRRIFSPLVHDVAEGMLGNAKTNYNKSMTDHCSQFGKYKGVKVK